jgi:hypothetical protein
MKRKNIYLNPGWVAIVRLEADRLLQISPSTPYGTAHMVSELCPEIQRQAKRIEELERKPQHAQQHLRPTGCNDLEIFDSDIG